MIGCQEEEITCNTLQVVKLLFNKDPLSHQWELLIPRCLLDDHEHNMQCTPYMYSTGSVYSANSHGMWTRITLALPQKTFSRLDVMQTTISMYLICNMNSINNLLTNEPFTCITKFL